MISRRLLGASLLALSGCAALQPAPPAGVMWAYFSVPDGVDVEPDFRAIAYTADRKLCEQGRAKARSAARECSRVSVGLGADYWVFVVAPNYSYRGWDIFVALGGSDERSCVRLRRLYAERLRSQPGVGVFGGCQPIGVVKFS